MEKPKFVMMCGLPGSGKTDRVSALKSEDSYVIVTIDTVKNALYGEDYKYNKSDAHEIFQAVIERIIQLLTSGNNVIYEAVNLKLNTRKELLDQIKSRVNCTKICELTLKPIEECIESNKTNGTNKISEKALLNMYYYFDLPYFYEGFDLINITKSSTEPHTTRWLFDEEVNGLNYFTYTENDTEVNLGRRLQNRYRSAKHSLNMYASSAVLYSDIGRSFISKNYSKYYTDYRRISAYMSMFYTDMYYDGILRFTSKEQTDRSLYIAIIISWRNIFEIDKPNKKRYMKMFDFPLSSDIYRFSKFMNDVS